MLLARWAQRRSPFLSMTVKKEWQANDNGKDRIERKDGKE